MESFQVVMVLNDFDARFVSCLEAIVEPGLTRPNDGTMLTSRMLPKVPIIFFKCVSISLLEVKGQVRQFLAARYPADF